MFGSLVTAVYRTELAGTLPSGLSSEGVAAVYATLGGATAVAGQLPGALGSELLAAARAAFAQSFDVLSIVSAVIAVGIAVLAVATLRQVKVEAVPS